ncbi:DUF305 domain-containing protein [Nonomuraea turcica]|uniref:DUF305 domain-containing protein n=1 Tax=Nonomuraea sp. G32 TaxID=3067274 RepID=UPI00273B75C8|nr:DUF305 domain-containing protein [Nonomuraea sp. G32]MDP4505417.1 DUF305 domain-containing protein [Nonomuraea sp. G32]
MRINRKLSFAAAAGALALLTACGSNGDSMAGHEGMSSSSAPAATPASSSPAAAFNDADVTFAQMMIPHHEQAVEMADLAATRASDPEIKELAVKIKAAQDPEIQTMKAWLTGWGKAAPEGDMGHGMGHEMPGVMSEEEMKKLEAAKGTEFDKLFAQQMIAHHNGAIEMARTEQTDGSNPEAKELAKTIETAQQAEVEDLQKILDRL